MISNAPKPNPHNRFEIVENKYFTPSFQSNHRKLILKISITNSFINFSNVLIKL